MAESDIIQNLITQLGQSQQERQAKELGADFVKVDEQTTVDLLRLIKDFSEFVNYYKNNSLTPEANWSNFFPFTDQAAIELLLKKETADITPHLALLLTFLELYKHPQSLINQITTRHLDFYYQDVLQLKHKAAIADKVHLLLEIKKNVAPIEILPEYLFTAGKDATDVELIYAPTRKTIINAAKVESLRSIFFDSQGGGTIRYAPTANSADGLGRELAVNDPKWTGFGNPKLPPAPLGFAIASPVLRMQEGIRQVSVSLQLRNVDVTKLNNTLLNGAFDVFITSEKSWLGPYTVSPILSADNLLSFSFTLLATDKAVIDYNGAIHGYFYNLQMPVMQILLKANNSEIGCKNFSGVTIENAAVSVEVENISSLRLENDSGMLDSKKAFLPFGPQPTKGSRFLIGYPEAFAKKLSEVKLKVQWQDTPIKFATHYQDYGTFNDSQQQVVISTNNNESVTVNNSYFTATVSFEDGSNWVNTSYGVQLFNSTDATLLKDLQFTTNTSNSSSPASSITEGMKIYALTKANSSWAINIANDLVRQNPVLISYKNSVPEPEIEFIDLILEKDFLHNIYRKKYIENIMTYSKNGDNLVILNEPYTPSIQSILLSYKASSDRVNIASTSLDDFANLDLQFFHISYFGQMREHGYQRQQIESQLKAGINSAVSLLPSYNNAGELLIGFSQLNAGDSVSVLFQVAEGSANPDLPSEELSWCVLCDNYWKPLTRSEVVLDSTNQLLTSGIIQFVIPTEATTENTILPSGLIWIKSAIKDNVTAVCQLINVAANAIEVQFVESGNDVNHLLTALAPGKITKLQNGISGIKTVKQPYSSFGGKAKETDSAFYTRVSERLRHKNRCLTSWDYERIILEAFPKVHKVKCIPHAKENSWFAPGHILIVVIPDLKNKNTSNLFEPKVDANTIDKITKLAQKRAGMQVKIKVKNPKYQKLKVDFKVKFYDGYEFNYYRTVLEQEIIRFLSPWVYDSEREIYFGGKIYKSVLLDFVEELPYVDYVTNFKLYSSSGDVISYNDINEVQPGTPDAILVSDTTHTIAPAS